MERERILILGAAGRDFHNFNVLFRDNDDFEVVGFTAAQIPDIEGRVYPAELAGKLYSEGIPIFDEAELIDKINDLGVDGCVFSYSDVSDSYVMRLAQRVNATGADFVMVGAYSTMIDSQKPVVAICAVRTGCGKSQTTRYVCQLLEQQGHRVVPIRHPMPYGDLAKQAVQRFGDVSHLEEHQCTIEEMEEYEPHLAEGRIIYAGVDYGAILTEAEKEADIIIWDGGNNDTSFYTPDILIVVVDPLRVGHELSYYPGYQNLLMADVVIVNKVDTASEADVDQLCRTIRKENPLAKIIQCESPVSVDQPELIKDKCVLVIEDGPTCTHGGMDFGAGMVAARQMGCKIVDPRPWLQGKLRDTFHIYPNIGSLLPAMGYGAEQVADLKATIDAMAEAGVIDAVVIGTPIDLSRVIEMPLPAARVTYRLEELDPQLDKFLQQRISTPAS
ncbi:GTPase [Candidatus Parcubacteria bacterium]|nr:MAG: GTPase [Candidatus Parcubacteria bacterium]